MINATDKESKKVMIELDLKDLVEELTTERNDDNDPEQISDILECISDLVCEMKKLI